MPDGSKLPLPPALLGVLGNDKKKKTILIYGHLDVQPAKKEDGYSSWILQTISICLMDEWIHFRWDTDPFVLTDVGGKLFGRGSTDDKGPVLGWIHAIEAYQKKGVDLPVNLKFIFEGMEESGSEGLEELVEAEKKKFLTVSEPSH